MAHRLEGLIFPSVLLANKILRLNVLLNSRALTNILLNFLGNGLTCGEVIRPICFGDALLRHWSMARFAWKHTEETRGWCGKDGPQHARLLFDMLKQPDEYFLECASHDSDECRPDPARWYQEDTFDKASLLIGVCRVEAIARRKS